MRLDLAFVLSSVVVAQLSGCTTVSSIHRFIELKLSWLQRLTGLPCAAGPSRAHLPRLLAAVDYGSLKELSFKHFAPEAEGWVAFDGKTIRGGSRGGIRQAVVLAVDHLSKMELASQPQVGEKTSEIVVVRDLLHTSGLEAAHVTLDALHCNPGTLTQIAVAGGTYLTQVKENQPVLTNRCVQLAQSEPPLAKATAVDKGHGRLTEAVAQLLPLRARVQDERWEPADLRYVVSITRETTHLKSGEISRDTAFYVTNMSPKGLSRAALLKELMTAVRGHWAVESNNWVRDVTLKEDAQRTSSGALTQIMALLRSVTLAVLRIVGGNMRAALDRFCHVPDDLAQCLRRAKFL
jgi:predicted transposase YbfD/YdcC